MALAPALHVGLGLIVRDTANLATFRALWENSTPEERAAALDGDAELDATIRSAFDAADAAQAALKALVTVARARIDEPVAVAKEVRSTTDDRDYKGRKRKRATHRRYHDTREDLRPLALCNNINGPICEEAYLTSDPAQVTCGRCKRIMKGQSS